MKKFNYFVLLMSIFLLFTFVGCSSNKEVEEEVSTTTNTQENILEDVAEEDDYVSPDFIIEDNAPSEGGSLGQTITEEEVSEIPDSLVGTWTVVDGLPEGLSEYTLTIDPDGTTIQTTVSNDGTASSYQAYTVGAGTEYYITDNDGFSLMQFNYDNGQITTYGLTNQESTFQKQ